MPQFVYPFALDEHGRHFQSSAVINNAAVNILYQALCGPVFALLLGKYLGAEWLRDRVSVCLTL